MKKRILAVLLTILMFVCLLSMTVFAAEGEPTVTAIENLVYDGQDHELVSADVPEGYTMYYAKDEAPLSANDAGWGKNVPTARDAGTYTVWYYAEDAEGKATEISKGIDVTISPMTLQDGELTAKVSNPPVYTGKELKPSPSVSVKVSGKNYSVNSGDYTAEYANNVNAGENTASVTVKAAEGGNYVFNDVTATFSIRPATAKIPGNNVELTKASRGYEKDNKTVEVQFTNSAEYVIATGAKLADGRVETLTVRGVSGSVTSDGAGANKPVKLAASQIEGVDGSNPGNYTVTFEDQNQLKFTIDKAEIESYEAPTAVESLVENPNGAKQQMVKAGSTKQGTMYYRLSTSTTWSNTANNIKASAAGTYTVEYYIDGGTNYQSRGSKEEPLGSVEVTIASAATGSVISGGSIAIIVVIAVVAAGAVAALVITKKKRSAN